MIEIKMDEVGYEIYHSLDEAVKAFSHNIALESATLDLDIGLMLESEVDPFSNYGMEAINEKVKEMASKAKSNFVLYAKKLINFFFGWIIKFIQGTVNIKKDMSSNYSKAQKYLKALNKYETQARQASEKTVQVTNSGNIVVYGLTVIQLIIQSIQHIAGGLDEMKSIDPKNTSNSGVGLQVVASMIKVLRSLYAAISEIPTEDAGKLEKMIRSTQYDISKLFKIQIEDSGKAFQRKESTAVTNAVNKRNDGKVNVSDFDDAKAAVDANIKSDFKTKMELSKKFMSKPERVDMKCPEAWDYLRNQLIIFIGISKANKWDIEKYVKSAENARRSLVKTLDQLDPSSQNEEIIRQALKDVVEVGNMLAALQNSAGAVFKGVSGALNMLMTDVTKLGSVLTTIGGGPAKDKDDE